MKQVKNIFLRTTAVLIILTALTGCAQMLREFETKSTVSSVVVRMPAKSSIERDRLIAKVVRLGPAGTRGICKMLVAPGAGNDTKARYALSGMTMYVTRPGAEIERIMYAGAVIEALATSKDDEVKAFLIRQLQLAGRDEAVAALAEFVGDKRLCEPATQALLAIRTPAAEMVLLRALASADRVNRVTIIKALGELRSKAAAKELIKYATSRLADTRRTALYAVANIGDASAIDVLAEAAQATSSYERAGATSLYLLLARRLAEAGQKQQCIKICSDLIKTRTDPRENNVRLAALNTLVSAIGEKAVEAIEDDQVREQVAKYIETKSLPKEEGFVSLFNGKDLTGWKRHEGLPGHGLAGKWMVEDGAIVGVQEPPGKGGFLSTLGKYQDFELRLETKIDWPFDSGVFLRVGTDGKSHQVTLDYRPGGQIGGIYLPWTQGFVHHCPEGVKHFRKDQWNHIKIICQGEPAQIRVWVNGVLITNFQHTAETTSGVGQEGTICLQIHPGAEGYEKSRAMFRNIFIREIRREKKVNVLTEQEKSEGFALLFNGKDLSGWTVNTTGYAVEDGRIVVLEHTGGNLYTQKEYSNFVLRFEFKLTPGANNGLGIRAPLSGDAAYVGMELQILDDTADKYKNLKPYQYHGSIYGVVAAKRGHLKPVGQWNFEEVIANGRQITVNLNGAGIVDADIDKAATPATIDGRNHPGLKRDKGHIGFLGHGDRVEFRSIRIRELK